MPCTAERKINGKVISFLTNKWFKFGVSFLSIAYPVFLGFVAWLLWDIILSRRTRAHLLRFISLSILSSSVLCFHKKADSHENCCDNFAFLAFTILLFGFGNWFAAVPPIVVSVLIFLLSGTGETTKIIIGTIYLLMYVVGVLVYLTFKMLFGNITLMDVDLSARSTSYRYSPDKQYRIVLYVDPEGDASRSVSFYLEETDGDISLPFLECRNALGGIHIITSDYNKPADVKWKDKHTLYVDGRKREFNFDAVSTDDTSEDY